MEDRLDLSYRVLDAQMVDVDGRRCGRVDDVEFSGGAGEPLRLSALLTGHGLYPQRLPRRLRRPGRRLFGNGILGRTILRVPWEAVEAVEASVKLRRKARDLDLAAVDRDLERWIKKVPGG
jgi:sporulation protein YlmC with PRC-barrel domain